MADEPTHTPRGSGNPLKQAGALVKKHKGPAIIAAGGGAFFLLTRAGKNAEGGDGASQFGTIVPVMRELSDTNQDASGGTGSNFDDDPVVPDPVYPNDPDVVEPPYVDPGSANEGQTDTASPSESPTATVQTPPKSTPTAAAPQASGISISGATIPGAVGRTASGGGSNAYGTYTDWLVKFPAGTAHYYHYYRDEKGKLSDLVTGPHDAKGTIPSNAQNIRIDNTPPPVAPTTPTRPAPGTPGGGGPVPTVGNTPVGVSTGPATPQTQGYYQVVNIIMKRDGWVSEVHHYTSGPRVGEIVNIGHVTRVNPNPVSNATASANGWSSGSISAKYGYDWQTPVLDIRGY